MKENLNDLNPLSGLPGNFSVREALKKTLLDSSLLVVYIDLTDFKPYNEVYGFAAGDKAIQGLAKILKEAQEKLENVFAGHIGGDDFICVVQEENLEKLTKIIKDKFEKLLDTLYSPGDLGRKFIIGRSRSGERKRFPLMGICSAAFSPALRKLENDLEISKFAGYLKEAAKSMREDGGSVFLKPSEVDVIKIPLKTFLKDENATLIAKRTLIEAMGESGYAHCGRSLKNILDDDVNPYLLKSIIYAIGRLRYSPASEKLLKMLKSPNPHLRMRAAEALGNIGSSDFVGPLGEAIKDKNYYAAAAAIRALGEMGHPESLKYLKKLPEGASRDLPLLAAEARARLRDREAAHHLIEILENSASSRMKEEAAGALELIAMPAGAEAIARSALSEKSFKVKNSLAISFCRTAEQLEKNELAEFRDLTFELYFSVPNNIKIFFFKTLGLTGGERASKELIKHTSSRYKWERKEALEGIGLSGDKNTVGILKKSLKDYAPAVRAAGAKALGEVGGASSLADLRKILKDEDSTVRRSSARSIMQIMRSEYGV